MEKSIKNSNFEVSPAGDMLIFCAQCRFFGECNLSAMRCIINKHAENYDAAEYSRIIAANRKSGHQTNP